MITKTDSNSEVTQKATAASSSSKKVVVAVARFSATNNNSSTTTTNVTSNSSSNSKNTNNSSNKTKASGLPAPRVHYHGNSRPRRPRRLKLGDEEEEIIKQEERIEFQKVLDNQIPDIDPEMIHPLQECIGKYELTGPENTHSKSMLILLQYQCFKSYTNYSEDEEKQRQQILAQKKKRFELMKQKRAIRREKRKDHKLRYCYESSNLLSSFILSPTTDMVMNLSSRSLKDEDFDDKDDEDEDDMVRESKRIKMDIGRDMFQHEKQTQQQQQEYVLDSNLSPASSSATTDGHYSDTTFDISEEEEEEVVDIDEQSDEFDANNNLFSDAFAALLESLPTSQVSEIDLLDTVADDDSTAPNTSAAAPNGSSISCLGFDEQYLTQPQVQFQPQQQQVIVPQQFPLTHMVPSVAPLTANFDHMFPIQAKNNQYYLQRCNPAQQLNFLPPRQFGSYTTAI